MGFQMTTQSTCIATSTGNLFATGLAFCLSTWKPYKILPDKAVCFQRCRLHEIDSQNDTNWKYNQKCQNFHFLLLVFHQLSQRKCCAASYMMILEYHEKYGRRCNFSRQDRELYYLLSPAERRSRFSSRRDRDYILLFSCFETRTRNTDWISQGRARKISVNSHEISREREFSLMSEKQSQEKSLFL